MALCSGKKEERGKRPREELTAAAAVVVTCDCAEEVDAAAPPTISPKASMRSCTGALWMGIQLVTGRLTSAGAGDAEALILSDCGDEDSGYVIGDSSCEFNDASSCSEHASDDWVLAVDCVMAWKSSCIRLNEGPVETG